MHSAADMIEQRIRERAYFIWEANGRPPGRDKEFWQLACELVATDTAAQALNTKERPARQRRPRSKKASATGSPEMSIPASRPDGRSPVPAGTEQLSAQP
jgi:hypothetical protein